METKMIMNVDRASYRKVIIQAIKDFEDIEKILLKLGGQLEMDIQYYKPIFNDIINFFNNLKGSSMAKNKSSDPTP